MPPIKATLIASEIMRALMSMPDAMPARALETEPVTLCFRVLRFLNAAHGKDERDGRKRDVDEKHARPTLGGGSFVVAVSAGLATAAFSCRLAPAGTVEVTQRFGLPSLPSSEIVLHSTLSDAKSREALRALAAAFREHRSPAG
jgi:hypothetical protein